MSQPSPALPNETHLIWVDMEMTGLRPDVDRIIEIAVVVTDSELNVLAQGPVLAIHQPDAVLAAMDAWNTGTHGRSGLTDRVRASTVTEADAQAATIAFLRAWVPPGARHWRHPRRRGGACTRRHSAARRWRWRWRSPC